MKPILLAILTILVMSIYVNATESACDTFLNRAKSSIEEARRKVTTIGLTHLHEDTMQNLVDYLVCRRTEK